MLWTKIVNIDVACRQNYQLCKLQKKNYQLVCTCIVVFIDLVLPLDDLNRDTSSLCTTTSTAVNNGLSTTK